MKKMVSINPATGEINGEFELYSQNRVNEVVKKAKSAFSEWRNFDISDRAEYLKSAAKVLRRRKEELGKLITTQKAYITFEPRGIVLSIMPWNFPFWQALRFGSPALAGGNVVILKHSSYVPLCALELEKVFLEAGFSEGVYQTLLIDGAAASSLICRDEISAVSLTGSVSAGQKVAEIAGKNIKKVVLELGGSDPFIVLDDADIEEAAKVGVASRFIVAGQSCIAAKRFIIIRNAVEEFTSKFVEFAKELRVGDPMDKDTDIGPLVREEQLRIDD